MGWHKMYSYYECSFVEEISLIIFLWSTDFNKAGLHKYFLEWEYNTVGQCNIFTCSITANLFPIFSSSMLYWESIQLKEEKGLLHLLSPHNSGDCVLWDNPLYVHKAKVQRHDSEEADYPVLWGSHPHDQSYHLQPEEQGSAMRKILS